VQTDKTDAKPISLVYKRGDKEILPKVLCLRCSRLLFCGRLFGEIKCPRCGEMNRWPRNRE